jgi:hypothetical protein
MTRLALRRSQLEAVTVGFSGVLFGLKAVLEWEAHRHSRGGGGGGASSFSASVPAAARALLWWAAEMLLCQAVEPRASWLGHAAGALAGAACAVTPPPAQAAAIAAGMAWRAGLVVGGVVGGGGPLPLRMPLSAWWGARSRHVYLQ